MSNRVPHVLLIGPLPPPIGGTRVSFQHLVEFLSGRPELTISVVELRPLRRNPLRSLFSAAALLLRIVRELPRADLVSLHCNPSALFVLGSVVALLARATRRPFMVRTFGGLQFLHEYRGIRRAMTRWVLRGTDLYLAQTKAQAAMGRSHGLNRVRWFPTSRPMPSASSRASPSVACMRFVFCSHVKPSKGILEMIEAAEQLGSDAIVDVYGPFREGMTEEVFRGCRVVRYRGTLAPEQVGPTLRDYDALLLPTYFAGEGIPGIIVEAYGAGIPVIATRWQAIPEIVDEDCGLLVEPCSAASLQTAMRRLMNDSNLFHALTAGAANAGVRHSMTFWGPRFIELCSALSDHRPLPADPEWEKKLT